MRQLLLIAFSILFLSVTPAIAQFEVNSNNDADDGTCDASHCSLREAINAANALAGQDAIVFNILGGGMAATIQPGTPLPVITDAVIIDGSTQGCPATRCVELSGINQLAVGTSALRFSNHGGSILSNMIINYFDENQQFGVYLQSANSITVENCLIGLNFIGGSAAPNFAGIAIDNASGNTIRNNVTSGNSTQGIVGFSDSDGNIIENNIIGMDATASTPIPNGGGGVVFSGGSDNNIIVNNTIANNGIRGVQFNDGAGNRVSQNRIFNNAGIGIELLPAGATPNDAGDADTGANNLQNSPAMATAALTSGLATSLSVDYLVDSAPANSAYPLTVEFFLVDSDNQEGAVYLGSDIYKASEAQSSKDVSFVTEADVPNSATIVATATDANGNTSEFSAAENLFAPMTVNSNNDLDDGSCDAGHCSLREAITTANALPGSDKIIFNIPGGAVVQTIQVTSQLPLIIEGVVIDGSTQGCPSTRCIELDGTGAGTVDGLQISNSSGSLITGMIINRFGDDGISIEGASSTNNTIENNSIGTNATGDAIWGSKSIPSVTRVLDPVKGGKEGDDRLAGAFGNGFGVYIPSSSGNTVRGNTISGNTNQGILLQASSSNNLFEENVIGTDLGGTLSLGNSVGIRDLGTGSTHKANIVAFNTGDGLSITGSSSTITQNSVYQNGQEGIDLGTDGPTTNDVGDADAGPNNLQNYPEISFASFSALLPTLTDNLTIDYSVPSDVGNSAYPLTVEFFVADQDDLEGQTYLGSDLYTAPGTKLASITPIVDAPVGSKILATATDANGNTSEFSTPAILLDSGPSVYWIDRGSFAINRGNLDGLGAPSLLYDADDGIGGGPGGFSGQVGLELDRVNGKIYWNEGNQILRANQDGSGAIEVLYDQSDGLVGVVDIEIDTPLGLIYWMDTINDVIQRAPLDGSGPIETLFSVSDAGLVSSFNLALDRPSGKIYWASFFGAAGPNTGIFRGDLDGGNVERIVETLSVSHIALDQKEEMIYWTSRESGNSGIKRMAVDGSGSAESLYDSPSPELLVLDRANEKVYWTDSGDDEIKRGSMDGSAAVETLYEGQDIPEGIDLGQLGVKDFTFHLKNDPSWGLPRISFDNTTTGGIQIPEPGISMKSQGCDWYSYTFRGVSSVGSLRFRGDDFNLRSLVVGGIATEGWFNLFDPGDASEWGFSSTSLAPADFLNCTERIDVDIRVALSGPYNDIFDEIGQGLSNSNLIPSVQAYTDPVFLPMPQYYGGLESWLQLGAGKSDAVDWVIVELRMDPNDPLTTVAKKAGILLKSGLIIDPDLSANSLSMPVPPGSYHIIVRHRNHLPIMSASAVAMTATSTAFYDFRTSQSQAFGTNPMIQVDPSPVRFGMRAGDGDISQTVSAFDFLNVWLPANGGGAAYEQADFNMDGDPSAFDFLNGWLPNNGSGSQIPE